MRIVAILTAAVLALSGCLVEPDRFQRETHTMETPAKPGLRLTIAYEYAERDGHPNRLTVNATAENWGNHTVYVSTICVPPWRMEISGPDGRIEPEEPRPVCLALGYGPFEPGQALYFNYTWDTRAWDVQGERLEQVPDGNYTVRVFFDYLEDGAQENWCCPKTLDDRFSFTVGLRR